MTETFLGNLRGILLVLVFGFVLAGVLGCISDEMAQVLKDAVEQRPEMTQWQLYTHPAASFEYPPGWKVIESQGSFRVEHPGDAASFIQIFYGSGAEARDTNICYTHHPADFTYWDYDQSQSRPFVTTRDGVDLSKLVAVDVGRYYACAANKRISFEAITYGDIPEDVFDRVIQTFHFAFLEPIENWVLWESDEFENTVTFKLPSTVREPTCNQAICFSKGTMLPGGTRLTIALRGDGQHLSDSLERFVQELEKTDLYQAQMTLHNRTAVLFEGGFLPRESLIPLSLLQDQKIRIRGFVIETDNNTFIEITISAPFEAQIDFHSDEQLLAEIIRQLQFIP